MVYLKVYFSCTLIELMFAVLPGFQHKTSDADLAKNQPAAFSVSMRWGLRLPIFQPSAQAGVAESGPEKWLGGSWNESNGAGGPKHGSEKHVTRPLLASP